MVLNEIHNVCRKHYVFVYTLYLWRSFCQVTLCLITEPEDSTVLIPKTVTGLDPESVPPSQAVYLKYSSMVSSHIFSYPSGCYSRGSLPEFCRYSLPHLPQPYAQSSKTSYISVSCLYQMTCINHKVCCYTIGLFKMKHTSHPL